jgi:hypothetical protein
LKVTAASRPIPALFDPSILESVSSQLIIADGDIDLPGSYSKVSYYTVLALYAMSFPGVWSQIKRSTSAKIKRKTFVRYVRWLCELPYNELSTMVEMILTCYMCVLYKFI